MIEFIIICSLAFYGAYAIQQEGMILFKLSAWADIKFLNDWKTFDFIRKPLYSCPVCMPSIWGSAAYWMSFYDNKNSISFLLLMWVLSIIATAGLVQILLHLFRTDEETISSVKEYEVLLVDTLTEEESSSVMIFDLAELIALRPYIDKEGNEVEDKSIFFMSNDSYVVLHSYTNIIKDWEDARNVTIIRLVQI